jgi:hypothetical protein
MIAHGFEKYGSQEELEKDAIKHLYQVYVKVTADSATDPNVKVEAAKWFKRMEDGDEDALKNWRVWRELSVKKYEEEYDRLNVRFDEYLGESMVGKEWQDRALERLESMGLISDANGAKLVDLEKWKLGKAILRKAGELSVPSRLIGNNTDLTINRRNIDIPDPRYRRCNRAIREIQIRQNDIRSRLPTRSAPRPILQDTQPNGISVGQDPRTCEFWDGAGDEHKERDRCVFRRDYQGGEWGHA